MIRYRPVEMKKILRGVGGGGGLGGGGGRYQKKLTSLVTKPRRLFN